MQKKEQMFKNMIKTSFILFIGLMLVLSTFLILADLAPTNPDTSYNGVKFTFNPDDQTFSFQKNNQQIRTHAHPLDTAANRISPELTELLIEAQVIGLSESTTNASEWEPLAAFTVAEALRKGKSASIVRGYSDSEPMLDCSLATSSYPVVAFKRAAENSIVENENCVTIEYVDESFLFIAKDSVIYHALGVITPSN